VATTTPAHLTRTRLGGGDVVTGAATVISAMERGRAGPLDPRALSGQAAP